MAADIHAENMALIAQKSPAVAGKPILHEGLRVVHVASPSRSPIGQMGGSCADDHYSTLIGVVLTHFLPRGEQMTTPAAALSHTRQAGGLEGRKPCNASFLRCNRRLG